MESMGDCINDRMTRLYPFETIPLTILAVLYHERSISSGRHDEKTVLPAAARFLFPKVARIRDSDERFPKIRIFPSVRQRPARKRTRYFRPTQLSASNKAQTYCLELL